MGDIGESEQTVDDEFQGIGYALGAVPRFKSIKFINFLSYKDAILEFEDFVALVGPNASGKSNAVAAIKLLREIPILGLPTAIARRGGFDQLRHRSAGRPNNPGLRLTFVFGNHVESYYELKLAAVKGKQYRVAHERAEINVGGLPWSFESDGRRAVSKNGGMQHEPGAGQEQSFPVGPGQSALSNGGLAGYVVGQALQRMQTVEVNPVRVGELQEPSSIREFEPDGSNTTSIWENLPAADRNELLDELAGIVPGITRIEVRNLADRQTLAFVQDTLSGNREFFAKQMSDGTLRSFSILLAMLQPSHPSLLVIEEPEIAIHLGALRTLVDILKQQSKSSQIAITTHSADIVDSLPVESLRLVWNDSETSHISMVAEHSREAVRKGMMTPGELLRADALDPAEA